MIKVPITQHQNKCSSKKKQIRDVKILGSTDEETWKDRNIRNEILRENAGIQNLLTGAEEK
jgi:hypothetical protein